MWGSSNRSSCSLLQDRGRQTCFVHIFFYIEISYYDPRRDCKRNIKHWWPWNNGHLQPQVIPWKSIPFFVSQLMQRSVPSCLWHCTWWSYQQNSECFLVSWRWRQAGCVCCDCRGNVARRMPLWCTNKATFVAEASHGFQQSKTARGEKYSLHFFI